MPNTKQGSRGLPAILVSIVGAIALIASPIWATPGAAAAPQSQRVTIALSRAINTSSSAPTKSYASWKYIHVSKSRYRGYLEFSTSGVDLSKVTKAELLLTPRSVSGSKRVVVRPVSTTSIVGITKRTAPRVGSKIATSGAIKAGKRIAINLASLSAIKAKTVLALNLLNGGKATFYKSGRNAPALRLTVTTGDSVTPSATATPPPTTTQPTGGSTNPLWVHHTVSNDTVRAALGKRVFFGHQSIGAQALKGVSEYARDAGLGSPTYPDPESGGLPSGGGFLAQSYVGVNGDPLAKLAEFDRILRSGVANRVDAAVIKLCYADIRTGTQDPAAVFDAYKRTLSALERDYPNVTFLYATEPIVMASNSDGPNNIPRGVFNNLMRAEYGMTGRLWDVAAIESSTLGGQRVTGTHQGTTYAALNPEFASSDQRHITGPGLKAVAGPLLELIAKA